MSQRKLSEPRFVLVTGGVVSSLGKGLAAASLEACLRASGFFRAAEKVGPLFKCGLWADEPKPTWGGFVTEDGEETDLDLGHYERFTCATDIITTGKVYQNVIQKERRGEYLGETIQVIPHITDEIKAFITHDSQESDFVICEIGGTIGDRRSSLFRCDSSVAQRTRPLTRFVYSRGLSSLYCNCGRKQNITRPTFC